MADHALFSNPDEPGTQTAALDQATATLKGDFDYDWYIRVKVQFSNFKQLDRVATLVKIEEEVAALSDDLRKQLPVYDIRLWPQRLIDRRDEANDEISTWYWMIGMPTIPSSDLAVSKQYLSEWQGRVFHNISEETSSNKNTIQARFISRKLLLQQDLLPADNRDSAVDVRRSGNTFKKISGSNPQQIRQQFLRHAVGYDETQGKNYTPSAKLRPARDILNRLKYDSNFNPEDFVIGYIDRKDGILEKSVLSWRDFEPEDHIAYFKQVSENCIVWDRAKKIDRLFVSQN